MSIPSNPKNSIRSLFLGGILPLIVFTLIEEKFGTYWGLIAGMFFGIGEVIYEKITQKKVATFTWVGNGLLLAMGAISIFTNEGIWFKLQPALIEIFMAALLIGSSLWNRPFLLMVAKKQNTLAQIPEALRPILEKQFSGFNFRMGLFFLAHTILAVWVALYGSTRAWALLKGVGLTVSLIIYMGIEILFLRAKMKKEALKIRSAAPPEQT